MTETPCKSDGHRHEDGLGGRQLFEIEDDERPSEAVIRGISTVTGRSFRKISPLFESIDPDALDTIFKRLSDGTPRASGQIVFPLDGCLIAVEGTHIQISRVDEGTEPNP